MNFRYLVFYGNEDQSQICFAIGIVRLQFAVHFVRGKLRIQSNQVGKI
jgi:hypothetical protein